MPEQMAIMRGVKVGLRDTGHPCLWFEMKTSENTGSLQVLSWEGAKQLLIDARVFELSDLEGRPCVASVDPSGTLATFVRVWKEG